MLAIIQNPYSKKPEDLLKQIKAMAEKEPVEEKFDEHGFEALKAAIGGATGTKIIVKAEPK